jgi:AraC-like DNA-binding protein
MLKIKNSADLQNIDRPVALLEDEYPKGFVDDWHNHSRDQLIYASKGVISISTANVTYVIPPQRALWIPARTNHKAMCKSNVSLRTLYVDSHIRRDFPKQCKVISVSELLRALILQTVNIPSMYELDSRNGHIMQLILDEIEFMPHDPLHIAMPTDKRIDKVCQIFLADPSDNRDIDEWANQANMSRRTFTRQFRQEMDLSFSEWRQQVRMLEAISRIAAGAPITSVSLDVGYSSPSAFTSTFHKAFGVPPSKYFE